MIESVYLPEHSAEYFAAIGKYRFMCVDWLVLQNERDIRVFTIIYHTAQK